MPDAREVGITAARATLADLINETVVRGQITYLTSHGRRVAALVPVTIAEDNDPTTEEKK